jgi:hypothetical protein
MVESIYYTLPDIISMYQPDFDNDTITNLVNEGTLDLAEAVIDAMQHKTNVTAADFNSTTCQNPRYLRRREHLQSRDILGDIGGFFSGIGQGIEDGAEDAACSIVALGANPAFSAAAGTFHSINGGAVPMTDVQLFFVRAALGSDIPSGIVVNYDAVFPFFFPGGTVGITFDTYIYTKFGPYNTFTFNKDDIFSMDDNFASTTAVIVHETQHVLQYASFGWNLWNFGYEYLYDYCLAGFVYSKNYYEVQAYTTQYSIYPLLEKPFSAFFNIWGAFDLQSELGFPTTVDVDTTPWNGQANEALVFDKGMLEIRYEAICFRVWSGGDWATLAAGNCEIAQVPVFSRTKPCPPACGKPPDVGAIEAHNKACKDAKKKAAALRQSKAWNCPQTR